jgi:alkyl hydroperoxide reductase subunit AhpF
MSTTINIESGNIFINSMPLEEILSRVYQKGKSDASFEAKDEKVTFIQLSKELAEKGRKISVRTLQNRARENNIKISQDGKRLSVRRKDISNFITL